MKRPINISEARSRLPDLARRVTSAPGVVEYIEHRDLDGHLALTTASHIRYLETVNAELKKMVAKPFSLSGSISSRLSDAAIEDALAAARDEQRQVSVARLDEFLE